MSARLRRTALAAGALLAPVALAPAGHATPATPALTAATAAASAGLPSSAQWYADVRRAMRGSQVYVADRAAHAEEGERLAINLDIDNTSLATQMDHMKPIPRVQRFVGTALRNDVTVLFNTGRRDNRLADVTRRLKDAGYQPTEVCGRQDGEGLSHSKQRCRRHFVDEGYTIVANVGNRSTDFTGGNYERAFKLPNYGNRLG